MTLEEYKKLIHEKSGLLENINTPLTQQTDPDDFADKVATTLGHDNTIGIAESYKDKATWGDAAKDLAGEFAWGFQESAAFGVPDILAQTTGVGKTVRQAASLGRYRPWEEDTALGKTGYILGSGLGMLVPLTGWGRALHTVAKAPSLISKAVRGTSLVSGKMYANRAAGIGAKLTEEYAEKKGVAQLANVVSNLGDDAVRGLVRDADDMLGFYNLNPFKSPRFRKVAKSSSLAYDETVAGIMESTRRWMPDLDDLSRARFADDFLQVMLKSDPGDVHKVLRKLPYLQREGRRAEMATAFASNALTGLMYHTGNEVLQNAAFGLSEYTGVMGEIDSKAVEKESRLFRNKSALDFLGEAAHSAVAFGLIAPAHYVRGGRKDGLLKEGMEGLWNMAKAMRPIRKLSDKQAIARVKQIEASMQVYGDTSLREFVKYKGINKPDWFNYISGAEAKQILKDSRTAFAKEWVPYMLTEAGKDLAFSSPRMMAGAMLMQLPSLVDNFKHGARGADLIGDPREFAAHWALGMAFSKKGRQFSKGRKLGWGGETMWQTDAKPDAYTTNPKRAAALSRSMDILGMKAPIPLARGPLSKGIIRTSMEEAGEWKHVKDTVEEYYVDKVDTAKEPSNAKPIDEAYKEGLKEDGIEFTPEKQRDLHNAIKILEAFDQYGPAQGFFFRNVTGREAMEIVDRINKAPELGAYRNNVDGWIRNAETKALTLSAQNYINPINAFLAQTMDGLGIQYEINPKTGQISMPEIDLNQAVNKLPPERAKDLRKVIDAFNQNRDWGINDGTVRLDGTKATPEISKKSEDAMIDNYHDATRRLNQKTYGEEIGQDPLAMPDMDILINSQMRGMYGEIKASEQRQNLLQLFEAPGPGKTTSTMDPTVEAQLRSELLKLKLDRPVNYQLGSENPESAAKTIEYYEKVRELYRLSNGEMTNRSAESMSISDINAGLDKLFGGPNKDGSRTSGVFGDIFANEFSYRQLKNSLADQAMDRLNIIEGNTEFSVKQGLKYLINGSVNEKSSPQEGINTLQPGGIFVRQGVDGLTMPDSKSLFQSIVAKRGGSSEGLEDIMGFYDVLQSSLRSTGGKIRFSANTENIEAIIQHQGVEGTIQLLRNAKMHSDLGKIQDMMKDPTQITRVRMGVEQRALQLEEQLAQSDPKIAEELSGQMRSLFKSLSKTENDFDVARREHNYGKLLELQGEFNNYSKMIRDMEAFLEIDPTAEGTSVTAYRQELVRLQKEAFEIANQVEGQVSNENLTEWVREKINKNSRTLPDKEHAMEVTITPQRYQTKYGIYEHEMNSILDGAAKDYVTIQPDGTKVYDMTIPPKAFDAMVLQATEAASRSGIDVNAADLITDSIQIVSSRLFRAKTKKLTYINGKFELTDSFIVPHSRKGLGGLDNYLNLTGDWYQLNNESTFTDGLGIKRTQPGLGDMTEKVEADIMAGRVGIDRPDNEVKFLQQAVGAEAELLPNRGLVRVVFGEVSALYPIKETKTKVNAAFAEGGSIYNELAKHLRDTNPEKLAEISRRYSGEMTPQELSDAINYTWTVLNMPHLVREGNISDAISKDAIKRRKLAHYDRGKVLTQEYYEFLRHAYDRGSVYDPVFGHMRDLLNTIGGADGRIDNKRQKFVSIDDASGTLTVRSMAERVYKRYRDQGLMTKPEYDDAIAEIKADLSAVDSPTFVTRNAFFLELAKMGARPDWFIVENGEIVGVKTGAIKPKGVHVEVGDNGSMSVIYNKTAMFYDPALSRLMGAQGLDGVMFKSGNKINKYAESAQHDVVERYTEPSKFEGDNLSEIIQERINTASATNNILELPYDTHVTMNLSREHGATLGPNSGIHFPHSVGMDEWMGNPQRIQDFKMLLHAAKSSEFTAAGILTQLIKRGRDVGDAQTSKLPYEVMLQESGLVLQPHLNDIAMDKLFSYFFEGGKIASQNVQNSSYNAMMPDINSSISTMELPVRSGGSQRLLGQYVASDMDLRSIFKPFGMKTQDNSIQSVGSTFTTMIEYTSPGGIKKIADVVIIPEGKKVSLMVDGYYISESKVEDLAWRARGDVSKKDTGLKPEQLLDPKMLDFLSNSYKNILDNIPTGSTYGEVLGILEAQFPKFKLANAQVRQPRNSMNDFLITKVTGKHAKEQGNVGSTNAIDLALTQDADVDFDKSGSFMSAPPDVYKHAMGNAGIKVSTDSHRWAESLFHKLETDLANDVGGNSDLGGWLKVHGNAELMRGQFVKLHNVATYFMNAFPLRGKIGEYKHGGKIYEIRVRNDNPYVQTVGHISDMVKLFIDSYKNIPMSEKVSRLVDDLLLGDVGKEYKGLFSVEEISGMIPADIMSSPDVRNVIKYKFISPLKKYLRYNRGVNVEGAGKFTINDAYKGWNDLMFEIGEYGKEGQKVWLGRDYKTDGITKDLDISEGMLALRRYIVTDSQSPFDRMMRNLHELHNQVNGKESSQKLSEANGILFEAERELLRQNEKGAEATVSRSEIIENVSNRLWKYVQRDHDYVQLMNSQSRLEQLRDRREFLLAEPRDVNAKMRRDLDNQINMHEEVVADMQMRIAGEMQYMEGRRVFKLVKGRDIGELKAGVSNALVVWDSAGKIKEVIKPGEANRKNVYDSDSIVENGRRFELADPKKQQYLRARNLAFNDPAFIKSENGAMKVMSIGDKVIVDQAVQIYNEKLDIHKKALANGDINVNQYVTRAQAELHALLNGNYRSGINSELLRKGLIWSMLAPHIQSNTVTFMRGPGGEYIYDNKYVERTAASKVVEGYLTGLASESKFNRMNSMTSQEATRLLREIAQRQTLAFIGLSKPEVQVVMELGLEGSNWYRQKNRQDVSINPEAYKGDKINEVDPMHALEMMHDFIGRGKIISPFDMHRLSKIISQNTGVPLHDVLRFQGLTHKRSYGNYGRSPVQKESIDQFIRRMRKENIEGCK